MSWNYRVVHRRYKHADVLYEDVYAIHEVYYGDGGVPDGVTEEPDGACGETLDELCNDHRRMGEAIDRPVIEWADIVKDNP